MKYMYIMALMCLKLHGYAQDWQPYSGEGYIRIYGKCMFLWPPPSSMDEFFDGTKEMQHIASELEYLRGDDTLIMIRCRRTNDKPSVYKLAWDNIMGLGQDKYNYIDGQMSYQRQGVRVECDGSTLDIDTLKTLVDYGWHHIEELKQRRAYLLANRDSSDMSLDKSKIDSVLNARFALVPYLH